MPKCSYDKACDEWPQSVATVVPFLFFIAHYLPIPRFFLEQGWDDPVVLGSPCRLPTSRGWVRPQRFAMGPPVGSDSSALDFSKDRLEFRPNYSSSSSMNSAVNPCWGGRGFSGRSQFQNYSNSSNERFEGLNIRALLSDSRARP